MKLISNIFLKGLGVTIPLFLTVYFFYWAGATVENLVRGRAESLLGSQWYFPGMGILLLVLLIFMVGILTHVWFVKKIIHMGEALLNTMPIVKSVYSSIKDITSFLTGSHNKDFNQVVMVQVANDELKVFGLVSRESFEDLPEGIGTEETVAVYLPMSYQLGGYTVFVPRSWVQPVKMSMEEGLRFALTAGVSTKKSPPEKQ